MEATTDLFINLIQNNRILYDKSLKDFKNTRKKEEAWKNVAAQSRMSVDAAKKRYFSLRQKYSREKRNIEVKRRNKTGIVRYWVFYERLHFLDSFIQPRSTYTNDTKFEEDDDEPMDDTETLTFTPNIDIDLDEGIDDKELNELFGEFDDYASSEIHQHPNLQTVKSCQNYNDNCKDNQHALHDNSERITPTYILSEYTGEVSTIEHLATHTEDEVEEFTDMDNYVSPCPGTSSSQLKIPLSLPSNLKKQQPPSKSSDTRPLPQHRIHSSVSKTTIPAKGTIGQGKALVLERTVPSNRTATSIAPAARQNISSRADVATSDASKEKRIEAIRQRMESCLTAINNKVTEKGQRSPHAPFLAYLGTKLPNVPTETLPVLEKEILELVDRHSK